MKPEFVNMIAEMADPRLDNLAETLENTPPEVSIRLNILKGGECCPVVSLGKERVGWWERGIYLSSRPRFTFDPAVHQGRYYVQDASSMVTAAVARKISDLLDRRPLLWLDACAAPGGKTTAAIDGLPAGSLVVANEYDYARAEVLKENVAKWGYPSTVITRGDTSRFRRLGETFDVVAIDAPCSGEGMMRKDLTAREQWTPALVEECAARQREIIANLWDSLRPGGFLIYSTCTFNCVENELMIDHIRREYGAEPVDLPGLLDLEDLVDNEVSIPGIEPIHALRFIPGRIRGEGLFMAVLRKPGDLPPAAIDISFRRKKEKGKPGKRLSGDKRHTANGPERVSIEDISKACRSWLGENISDDFELLPSEDGIRAFPSMWSGLLPIFLKHLQVISAGVEMAVVKGKDIIPTQHLALSTILSPTAFPKIEISEKAAIEYLSKEAVSLPDNITRGIVMLTYGGFPLGFVKNLGNRSNNLYPKEWRIKSKA